MSGVLFLLTAVWAIVGVAAALTVLEDAAQVRAAHLRQTAVILALTLAGAGVRGEPWAWAGWAPLAVAAGLTYRFVRRASDRARAQRMPGRTVT